MTRETPKRSEVAYQKWRDACEAAMRRAMRHGTETIAEGNRRRARMARLKAAYDAAVAEERR